jgi:hypothetical protein
MRGVREQDDFCQFAEELQTKAGRKLAATLWKLFLALG